MRYLNMLALLILIVSCNQKAKKQEPSTNKENNTVTMKKADYEEELLLGGCSECSCPSWRPDSDNPEKCINIRNPRPTLCHHSKSSHFRTISDDIDLEIHFSNKKDNRLERLQLIDSDTIMASDGIEQETFNYDDVNSVEQNIYCLTLDRYEDGWYNGQRARFSVWKPRTGFSCCVIVNISRNGRIIARQRVTVTQGRMLRLLMGSVNGVSQGLSPCN